jgi:AcrR family transcriptional regulator
MDDQLWLPPLSATRPGRGGTRRRGRPSLSRERIVSTAISIADAEGTGAISIRRIARDLDVGNMTIYWYVASRDELIALMIDAVEGEFEIPAPSGDWRGDVTTAARAIRAVLVRHGWMASFVGFRRSVGPNELAHLENALATLTEPPLELDLAAALRILMAIETYVLGFALRDQQELGVERAGGSRLGVDDMTGTVVGYIERLEATGHHPNLTRMFREGIALSREERFEYGLARLLDGIEQDLDRR